MFAHQRDASFKAAYNWKPIKHHILFNLNEYHFAPITKKYPIPYRNFIIINCMFLALCWWSSRSKLYTLRTYYTPTCSNLEVSQSLKLNSWNVTARRQTNVDVICYIFQRFEIISRWSYAWRRDIFTLNNVKSTFIAGSIMKLTHITWFFTTLCQRFKRRQISVLSKKGPNEVCNNNGVIWP